MNADLIAALVAAVSATAGLGVNLYIARTGRKETERLERTKWIRDAIKSDVVWVRQWLDSTWLEQGVKPRGVEELFGKLLSIQTVTPAELSQAADALRVSIALLTYNPAVEHDDGLPRLLTETMAKSFGTPAEVRRWSGRFFEAAKRELGVL